MTLEEGQSFRFDLEHVAGDTSRVELPHPEIFHALRPGATLLGNDVSTATQLKLVDLALSPSFVAGFGGPKFGIAGLRQHLGIPERPILLNMIKPCTGFGPEVGARFFAESARGGVDIIKDDELLGNTSFSAMLDRVTAYRRAAQQVYDETGHRAAYCPNITDRPENVVENARRARELGADMVMVNAVTAGLGVVQAVGKEDAAGIAWPWFNIFLSPMASDMPDTGA